MAGEGVKQGEGFDFVIKKFKAQRQFRAFCGEDVDDIASDAKATPAKVYFRPGVLHAYQALDDVSLVGFFSHPEVQNHGVVVNGVANTVDAGDGGDNHNIPALHQAFGG